SHFFKMENEKESKKENIYVFVYGTLKRNQPNYNYLVDTNTGESKFVCEAKTIDKWPLVIASKFNIPYLLYAKGVGNRICGEIYSVNESKMAFLDDFEGYPKYYNRFQIPVEITSNGYNSSNVQEKLLTPWIYMLTDFEPQLLHLPMHECYDSFGSHGLRYVERCERYKFKDYNALNDVKCKQ
ncbi:gamma-glutamylaminecyclotransferase-like isoform X1, partial [Leptotrombidium deliense]